MTSQEIVDLVTRHISPKWLAISIDGSAFDSSQFAILMQCVDDVFFSGIKPFIRKVVEYWFETLPVPPTRSVNEMVDVIIGQLLVNDFDLFVHAPGVNGPKWSDRVLGKFRSDIQGSSRWPSPESDWIHVSLMGTTLSGHPTKTTLGNTLRSLCYMYFYVLSADVGIQKPWDSDRCFIIASGDDVVLWCEPAIAPKIVESIRSLSSPDKKRDSRAGCGQCIPDIFVGKFWEVEFCSKWSFAPYDDITQWKMCRDVGKLFRTKQYYRKSNELLHCCPFLHKFAMLEGFASEGVSVLVEDLLRVQLSRLEKPDVTEEKMRRAIEGFDMILHAQCDQKYTMEAYVDHRLGWTANTLLNLISRDVILGSRGEEVVSI